MNSETPCRVVWVDDAGVVRLWPYVGLFLASAPWWLVRVLAAQWAIAGYTVTVVEVEG